RLKHCVTEIVNQNSQPKNVRFETWEETCKIAATQFDDWFIRDWAEFGALHLFSGREKAGKSSVLADIIAASANGAEWAGKQVAQSPFILFDFENREKVITKRIKSALAGNDGRIAEFYNRIPPKHIPRPLTPEFLTGCIDVIKTTMKEIGQK